MSTSSSVCSCRKNLRCFSWVVCNYFLAQNFFYERLSHLCQTWQRTENKLATICHNPQHLTNLEEPELIWCVGRADNDCLNISNIYVTACYGKGYKEITLVSLLKDKKNTLSLRYLQRSDDFWRSDNSYFDRQPRDPTTDEANNPLWYGLWNGSTWLWRSPISRRIQMFPFPAKVHKVRSRPKVVKYKEVCGLQRKCVGQKQRARKQRQSFACRTPSVFEMMRLKEDPQVG